MADLNGLSDKNTLTIYQRKFMTMELPPIPMIQCSGYEDETYQEMLKNAIKRGTPVNDDDYKEYFQIEEGVSY